MTAALSPRSAAPAAPPPDRRAALDEALRRAGRLVAAPPAARPPLPVAPALHGVLPQGLRRGTTVAVGGGVASTSLTLALLGEASQAGSWCALVGLPPLTAEAMTGFGLDLDRVAVVPAQALTPAGWTTAVGALVDAVDVVVVRPPGRLPDGDVRRLTARARSRGAVLVVVTAAGRAWPGADVRVQAEHVAWAGLGEPGSGRLRARQVAVTGVARGRSGAPTTVWLPGPDGGVTPVEPVTGVTPLRRVG